MFSGLLFVLSALFASMCALRAEIVVQWGTDFLVPGEETSLVVINTDGSPVSLTKSPYADGASVQPLRGGAMRSSNAQGGIIYVQPFSVKADRPGELKLPPLDVEINGEKTRVAIPVISVSSTAAIRWYDKPFPYGVLWHVSNADPYVNERFRASFKLFLPEGSSIRQIPQMEADGVATSFFLPSGNTSDKPASVRLKGETWMIANMSGEISALREGETSLSGHMPITVMVTRSPSRGVVYSRSYMDTIALPRLVVKALPLPPNAPEGFDNAVGQFTLVAKTEARSLSLNEPVAVELTVRGVGNLSQLSCPVPEDAASWKIYPSSKENNTNDQGETTGAVFRQLMRPTAEVFAIPAFTLVYFDPVDSEYKKISTAPIALEWEPTPSVGQGGGGATASVEPPPAGTVPVAEMTDIYGIVPEEGYRKRFTVPLWLLTVLYIPSAVLLCRIAVQAWRRRRQVGAARRLREKELSRVGRERDDAAFLRKLGGFVETHVPPSEMTPELQGVLRKRDEEVFRPESTAQLGGAERRSMLAAVRKALSRLPLLMMALLVLGSVALGLHPAEQAYAGGQYTEAVKLARQAGDDADPAYMQYLVGNAYYRLGKPGPAALAYARALAMHPGFPEAKANLGFIQRKEGAILPENHAGRSWYDWLSFRQICAVLIVAGAVAAACLALLYLRRGRRHFALMTVSALAVIVFAGSAAGCLLYLRHAEDRPETVDPDRLCYVVNPTMARNTADAESPGVISLPASTPVRVIAVRGSWMYVETFAHTRGWVPAGDLEKVGRL